MPLPDNEPPRRNAALRAALEYFDEYGLNPLAAALRSKIPLGEWRRYQTEKVPRDRILVQFSRQRNVWVPTGGQAPGRLLVLDCDTEAAVELWRDRLGDVLDQTACSKTARGYQFMFLAPAGGERIPGIDGRKHSGEKAGEEAEWEIKGDGQGVILPPSIHPTGVSYTWVRGLADRANAPQELLSTVKEASRGLEEGDSSNRSKLADLLEQGAIGGGRNSWLTQVAGHYAKSTPWFDGYEQTVRLIAATKCAPPLTDDDPEAPNELSKLIRSIWDTEQRRQAGQPDVEPVREDAVPTEDTGWLVAGDDRIMIQCRRSADTKIYLDRWLNADIKVLGVIAGETERAYYVEVRRPDEGVRQAILPAAVMSSTKELAAWLSAYGVSILAPPYTWPRTEAARGDRLLRYLEAQKAPEAKVVPHLGIHEGDFVTHVEIIRESGTAPFEAVRPDPGLFDWAPYSYGHAPREEMQAVLRKVLEFHDETVTSVFGAWWAAVLLKPFITNWVSQFPIIGLEAPSESGKTTGFFELMHKLSGWSGSQINPTRAALRDYLSAHNAGYVWVDDLDALGDREELLRQVTVGGSLVKKSGDHHGQTSAIMRAALAISGESLGLGGQKALLDRVVLLEVPNPKSRRGRDGRSQWEEIISFRNDFPDLTRYSGTLVRSALECVNRVSEVNQLRTGPGRHGDKVAVLRVGSRILSHLCGVAWGEGRLVERVDKWCAEMSDLGAENVLTQKILPWALEQTEWKSRPTPPDDHHGKVATPALVDEDGIVWFSPRLLARWWWLQQRGQVSPRTETEEALIQQARALGLGGSVGGSRKPIRFVGGTGKANYWRCNAKVSASVLERSYS